LGVGSAVLGARASHRGRRARLLHAGVFARLRVVAHWRRVRLLLLLVLLLLLLVVVRHLVVVAAQLVLLLLLNLLSTRKLKLDTKSTLRFLINYCFKITPWRQV